MPATNQHNNSPLPPLYSSWIASWTRLIALPSTTTFPQMTIFSRLE